MTPKEIVACRILNCVLEDLEVLDYDIYGMITYSNGEELEEYEQGVYFYAYRVE